MAATLARLAIYSANKKIFICISYDSSARDVAGLYTRDSRAVDLRARVPINRNIPSERCHNRFIFCCEVV